MEQAIKELTTLATIYFALTGLNLYFVWKSWQSIRILLKLKEDLK